MSLNSDNDSAAAAMHERRVRFDAYLRRNTLCSSGTIAPQWLRGGAAFWFLDPDDSGVALIEVETGCIRRLAAMAGLNRALEAAGATTPVAADAIRVGDDERVHVLAGGQAWMYDPDTDRAISVEAPNAPPVQYWPRRDYLGAAPVPEVSSPDEEWTALVQDGDLAVRSRDGEVRWLTHDADDDHYWDIEARRARLRPGVVLDTSFVDPWRPDGRGLLACRRDVSGVFRIPTVHWLKTFEEVEFSTFTKAGATLDRIQPYLVDVASGRATIVDIGPVEDRYVQHAGWRPDGSEAVLVVYTRDFKRVEVLAADAATGTTRVLLSEAADSFVRIQHEVLFYGQNGLALAPDGALLWISERDGHAQLYRYGATGEAPTQLTFGPTPVQEIVRVDPDRVWFVAAADEAQPYDLHLCRVPLSGGEVERLTTERGVHIVTIAPDGHSFLDRVSSVAAPTRTVLRRADGTELACVARMDITALEQAGYRAPEKFVVKAADGETDLWGVLYTPADFDPARTYPVIESIYGGPQLQFAPHHFSVSPVAHQNLPWALAQLGYVVVCLDARGTPGRSKAFQDVVYRQWGVNEIADHAAALIQLFDRYPWMDRTRVGITGRSWGGYFATMALIQAPHVYHAAVSSSPGYDPWDGILYEPYLDLPAQGQDAYDRANIIDRAGDVAEPLMIVSGTSEHSVLASAMKMTAALIAAGVQHELVLLPEQHHSYAGGSADYFHEKLIGWFDRHVMRRGRDQ